MTGSPLLRGAARNEWRVLTALLGLVCALLGYLNGLGRPDSTLYDFLLTSIGRTRPADIVIVAIDEPSLAELGRWPWSRHVHARLLERLADSRPMAVGLDIILSEPEPGADEALARAIKRLPVVLPVFPESRLIDGIRQYQTRKPLAVLAEAAAGMGHINQPVDADGIARSVFLRAKIPQGAQPAEPFDQFALAMLAVADPGWRNAEPPGNRNDAEPVPGMPYFDREVHFPILGGAARIQRVSYADVLAGRIPAAAFGSKFVFVGATAAGLGDAYPTPISGHSSLTPGTEIHANVLEALRGGHTVALAGNFANMLFNLVPLLLVMLALKRLSPRRGLATAAAMLVAVLASAAGLLRIGIWFAPTAGLAAIAVAYPLWSWRRLEATMRFLGEEFRRLAAEPKVLPEPAAAAPQGSDPVEARMLAVAAAADRLRNLRRFVSDTLEGLPDAAVVAGPAGEVLIGNRAAAALFGAERSEDLRGRSMPDLLARLGGRLPQDPPPEWDALKALAEGSATGGSGDDPARSSLECSAHAERSLLVRCAALTTGAGRTSGWIASFSDISDLRQAERAREEVLAFLSHDMRSPQSSILALLELHELDPDDNPKEEVHKRIEQYARRTLSLSEQFLQLARAESKAHEPTVEDLGTLAEEAIDEVWAAAGQKSIRVELKWDGEPVPVMADRALLLRAITNLLTNAVKYSPESTTVVVTVDERVVSGREMHVCQVADQGYGISADNQAKLFERYRRFSEPGQPKAQGAGLGMAFVKTVIEKHGGSIGVQSEPGKGSIFTLMLPPVTGNIDA